MKYKDEHALQGVKDGEEIRHYDCALVDVHQAERPGQTQQTQQSDGTDHPRPETHTLFCIIKRTAPSCVLIGR